MAWIRVKIGARVRPCIRVTPKIGDGIRVMVLGSGAMVMIDITVRTGGWD